MECSTACELICARIDRQLPSEESAALDAHLAVCDECRITAEALRAQDADLLRAFQPLRAATLRVADSVIGALSAEFPQRRSRPQALGWLSLLLAAAAGFLLAVLVFQPWKASAPTTPQPLANVPEPPTHEPPVATLVAATGRIDVRSSADAEWQAAIDPALIKTYLCPSGSTVRTGPNVSCELKTAEGCVVRLNEDSEVTLTSADTVSIKRGQLWCSSPDNVALKVIAADAQAESGLPWLACPSNSCLTAAKRNDQVQVTSSQGEAQVQASQGSERLMAGQSAAIVEGKIVKSQTLDPLLDAAWMHSLLILKGHDDAELQNHVNQLLAKVGQSKLNVLYEQQIRGLGDYGALPLLRYVQSPTSRAEPARRQTAMQILGDIAPTWMVGELVGLLSDDEAETRSRAARALLRLTGEDLGRTPEQWREPLAVCKSSIESWQAWWTETRGQYPGRVAVRLD